MQSIHPQEEGKATRKKKEIGWCSGGDLNPHALRHTPLKRTCLPFHHPSASAKFNQEGRKARSQGKGKIWKRGNQEEFTIRVLPFGFPNAHFPGFLVSRFILSNFSHDAGR